MWKTALAILVMLTGSLLSLTSAQAQATRTWVSGVGDDANPCSRTAPCKTFAGAISKTAAGVEINVLDPGGFGALTITKAINVVADGDLGGVLASLTNGIIINAGVNDAVLLRGLTINGAGNGLDGIKVLSAKTVAIEQSVVMGFTTGINVAPSSATVRVLVSNTTVHNNGAGVLVKPTGTGNPLVALDHVNVANNSGTGVVADGANAKIRMNNSVIVGNGLGLSVANNGSLLSFGTNALCCNVNGNGAAPTLAPLQ